jgi:putative glutamine amidotransferase
VSCAPSTPLIGVSTYRQIASWGAWERDAAVAPGVYLDMVEEVGGQAVLIPPPGGRAGALTGSASDRNSDDRFDGLIAALDALVLIGGGDMDPVRYRQCADPRNGGTSALRDELELGLLARALRAGLPVLAICRGMQVLNILLGGDLVQQLPDQVGSRRHQPEPGRFGPIEVHTEEGSTVRRLFGETTEVLCSHHQAIATLGRDLVVTARSEDGVIEAVELPARPFVVGVQWHPEESADTRLFEALAVAAAGDPTVDPSLPTSPAGGPS